MRDVDYVAKLNYIVFYFAKGRMLAMSTDDTYLKLVKRVEQNMHAETGQLVREAARELQVDRTPLGDLLEFILGWAVKEGASDIHFEPLENQEVQIRLRIDGELQVTLQSLPVDVYKSLVSKVKIICRLDIAENRQPQDGGFSTAIEALGIDNLDIRVSMMPVIYGECVVLRLLNNKTKFKHLDHLELLPKNQVELTRLCTKRTGGLLIAGPVNSGKTTMLYALLDKMNQENINVVSIEDPVEYCMAGVNQIQVNEKIDFTFEKALKAVLRQDLDCLAVGEVRSSETASLMISAGLVGHMVLGTIHTAGAVKTIFRLLDLGVKPYQIVAAISVIVSQQLVKKLCPRCRKAYAVENDSWEAEFLGNRREDEERRILYKAQGCDACGGSGYKGRILLQEILYVSPRLAEAICQGKTEAELESLAIEEGMTTIRHYGIAMAEKGNIELAALARIL